MFIPHTNKIHVIALIQFSNVDRQKPGINHLETWQFLPRSKLDQDNQEHGVNAPFQVFSGVTGQIVLRWEEECTLNRGDFAEVTLSRASFLHGRRS